MTQKEIILNYINDVGFITSMADYQLGITQLGARIFELKEQGYTFRKERINLKPQNGKATHYDKYFIERAPIC
jgi:hypothetical protein